MTVSVPLQEPERVRADTTWQWRREDLAADYPATSWTLKYALKNATDHFEITATADGAMFAVAVAPGSGGGLTGSVKSGTYRMVGWVEDAGAAHRFTVYEQTIVVDPAYTSTAAIDDRSHARIMLQAIQAMSEGRATKAQSEFTIGHRMLKYLSPKELTDWERFYQGKVREEDLKDAALNGRGGNKVLARL